MEVGFDDAGLTDGHGAYYAALDVVTFDVSGLGTYESCPGEKFVPVFR